MKHVLSSAFWIFFGIASALGSAEAQEFVTPLPLLEVNPGQGQISASFPLPALPGHGDFTPNLSLVYQPVHGDAAQGFGVGWMLGTSSIQVGMEQGLPHPYYSLNVDKKTKDTWYELTWDGQPLRYVGLLNGAVEYTTESFDSRVQILRYDQPFTVSIRNASGVLEDRSISSGFEMRAADGTRKIYSGDTSVAESYFYLNTGTLPEVQRKYTARWPLVYEIKPGGDAIQYQYLVDQGRSYLQSVSFGSDRSRYVFHWNNRPSAPVSFAAGFRQENRLYANGVVACVDEQPQFTWLFAYDRLPEPEFTGLSCQSDTSARALTETAESPPLVQQAWSSVLALFQDTSTGTSIDSLRLSRIYRFGQKVGPVTDPGIVREPTVQLNYRDWQKPADGTPIVQEFKNFAGMSGFGFNKNGEIFDVNQDGLPDIVVFDKTAGVNRVYLNQGQSFSESEGFKIKRGAVPFIPQLNEGTQSTRILRADLNGDGWEDLIEIGSDSSWTVFLNRQALGRTGYDSAGTTLSFKLDKAYFSDGRGSLIDINGDGRPDILYPILGTDGKAQFQAYINTTARGSGAISFTPRTFRFPFSTTTTGILAQPEYRLIDANQDGLIDLVKIVALSTGTKGLCLFENQGLAGMTGSFLFREDKPKAGVTCEDQYFLPIDALDIDQSLAETFNSMLLMDVNHDGIMDFTRIRDKTHEFEYWLGQVGQGGFAKKQIIPLAGDIKISKNKYDTLAVDMDQDGYDEILVWNADAKSLQMIDLNRTHGLGLISGLQWENGLQQDVTYTSYAAEKIAGSPPLPTPLTLVKQLTKHSNGMDADLFSYGNALWDQERARFLGFDRVSQFSPGTYWGGRTVEDARLLVLDFSSGLTTLEQRRYLLSDPKSIETYSLPWTSDQETAWQKGLLPVLDPAGRVLLHTSQQAYSLRLLNAPVVTGELTAHMRPRSFIKRDSQTESFPGGRVQRTNYAYDETLFRIKQQVLVTDAIQGPRAVNLPAGELETRFTYDADSDSRGILTNVQERAVRSLVTGRSFEIYRAQYHPVWGLPIYEISQSFVAAEDRSKLPESLAPLVPSESSKSLTTTYDGGDGTGFGLVESIADDAGLIESYTYGPGSLFRIATQNAKGQIAHSCYSDRDCLLTERSGTLSLGLRPVLNQTIPGYWTQTTLDALQRPVSVRSSLGEEQTVRYTPGSADRPHAVESNLADLQRTLYLYDAEGQVLLEAQGRGKDPSWIQNQSSYSRSGNVVGQSNPYAVPETLEKLTRLSYADLPSPPVSSLFAFDSLGRLVDSVSPGAAETAHYEYPAWGRIENKTADGITRTRQYIARDLQLPDGLIDEEDQLHIYRRNEFGLLREIQTPDDKQPRSFIHDTKGQLLASLLPGIQTRILERDTRGRIIEAHTISFDGKDHRTVSHRFDELDRLTQVLHGREVLSEYYYDQLEDPEGFQLLAPGALLGTRSRDPLKHWDTFDVFERDSKDRILRQKTLYLDAANQIVKRFEESRVYRADDQEAQARFDHRLTVDYTYDASGLLQELRGQFPDRDATRILSDVQWSPSKQVEKASFADQGFQGIWQNDEVHLWNDSRVLAGLQEVYKHDARGLLRSVPRGTFGYNRRGELTSVQGSQAEHWKLSSAGHFETFNQESLTSSVRSPLLPRAATALDIDGFGRVTGFAATQATYDAEDRLLQTTTANETTHYGFHVDGQRSFKKSVAADGKETITWFPGDLTIAGDETRVSLPLPGQVQVEFNLTQKTSSFLAMDAVHTPEARLDAKGQVIETWDRGSYGTLFDHTGEESTAPSQPGFGGHREDRETAWVSMGLRSYIPALGRFTTPDPLYLDDPERCLNENWQECELYTYVANNPVTLDDPTGLMAKSTSGASSHPPRASSTSPSRRATSHAVSVSVRSGSSSTHINVNVSGGRVSTSAKVIVIGEGMARVKGAVHDLRAQGINAKWYQAWGKNYKDGNFDMQKNLNRNERWLLSKMKEGYKIYDIGLNVSQARRSPFYAKEISLIVKHNYPTTPLSRSSP